MAGYSGQATSEQPEYANLEESKRTTLMTLTDASDKNAEQKQQFVDKTMGEAVTLEKELQEELKANLETWAFILPANIDAISANAPVQPPPEIEPPQASGAGKIQVKAIQELKPKSLLTQNMSRQDLLAWERQMQSYFKASNFEHCSSEIRICYLEERMDPQS